MSSRVERERRGGKKKEMVTLLVGFGIKYFMLIAVTFYQEKKERKKAMIGFRHVILFVAFGENLEFYASFRLRASILNGRRAAAMAAEIGGFLE